jgi:hypothetical protein
VAGGQFLLILFTCGLSAAIVARWKGNSVLLWFLIGAGLPILGTIAAFLYRSERAEPRRACPGCGRSLELTTQVCLACGTELDYPDELLPPPARGG